MYICIEKDKKLYMNFFKFPTLKEIIVTKIKTEFLYNSLIVNVSFIFWDTLYTSLITLFVTS